jgi:PAS domain S-box-containing protein
MDDGSPRRQHGPAVLSPDDFGIGRLFHQMRDAVIVADAASGRIVLWNPAAEAIFGFTADEALDMTVDVLVPPEHRGRHRAGLSRFAETGAGALRADGQPVELPARTKAGEPRVIELTLTPIEDAGLSGRFALAVVRDVTERRRAEIALREAEATYRGMFEHAAEGIYQTSPDGRLLNANPALARMMGYASPRALIDALDDIDRQVYLEPGRRAEFYRLLQQHGRVVDFESRVRRKDGSVIWISENARAVHGQDGTLRYVEGTVQDITPRRRAAAEQSARAVAEAEQQRLGFLAEASAVLASSLEYATNLRNMARLAVPFLADECAIDLLREDGSIERVAVASRDLERPPAAEDVRVNPRSGADVPADVAGVLHTGVPRLMNDAEQVAAQSAVDADPRAEVPRQAGATARMTVPLSAHGRTLGVMTFTSTDAARIYDAADLALVEELARRAALAIDNARLYESLAQSEQRFRSLVQKASDVVAVLGVDARVRYVSPPVERVLGYTPDELLGTSPGTLVHPDDRPTVQEAVRTTMTRPGEYLTAEFRLRHKNGAWRTMDVTANNLLADPAVRGIVVNLHDITERKRAEEEQRFLAGAGAVLATSLDYDTTLSQLMALAVPTLGDWSALDTVEADGSIRRLAVSCPDPAIARILEDVPARFPTDPRGAHPIAIVLRTGQPVITPDMASDLEPLVRDDEHRALLRLLRTRSRITVPLTAHGRRLGAISFGFVERDAGDQATERRRHDARDLALAQDFAERAAVALDNARLYHEAQAALEQMERSLIMRDEFLSVASHELRTPLTALKGQIQLAGRWVKRENYRPLPDLMVQADQQVDRLNSLIRDLLDASRIKAGGFVVEREPLAIGALLRRVVDLERAAARARTIELDMPDAVPSIPADPERIEQVLINLIQNARKYSTADAPIGVRLDVDERTVSVSVTDRGIGIPPQDLPRIFDRFHRAGNIDRNITGLGIGLYIAHQIVQAHGGEIRVRSDLDVGSTFTLVLPRVAPEP